ncbi:hypothetical protein INT45_000300 [Circinella minor]|uniref:Uncharacterized protein n=1 Tax=Circinella minor TaxID=1195481 RepID=A0A8H7S7N8_9FUNG|nr:hypothetical protein INT45_000300 [Circinella minor]
MPLFTQTKKVNSEASLQKNKQEQEEKPNASHTFLKDPVRNSNVPDILGRFVDPMGAQLTYTQGIDPTNTGA